MVSQGKASFLEVVGSLRFAAALLALLAVAMGAATFCESRHGSEFALRVFYGSWWFKGLFALTALNLLAAIVIRGPYSRRQAGFLVTHIAVLLIFAGAWISNSKDFTQNGHLSIAEGQTAGEFSLSDRPVLAVSDAAGRVLGECRLDPAEFLGFSELTNPGVSPLVFGDVQVAIQRYLPDAQESRRVVDDPAGGRPAVEAALVSEHHDFHAWVFAGETALVGALPVAFLATGSQEEFERQMNAPQTANSELKGTVKVEYEDRVYAYPVEQCLDRQVAVGETGYSIRVARYLPHAVVGPDKAITSASSQPVNPYIEVELTGPQGTEIRRAFARFPEFDGMHGATSARAVTVSFEAPSSRPAGAPAEVIAAPDGRLFCRFSEEGRVLSSAELSPPEAVNTPWEGWRFAVRQRREQARWEQAVVAVAPIRQQDRQAAIQLLLRGEGGEQEAWAMYGQPASVEIGGRLYTVRFDVALQPLGFQVKLDDFRIVTYPGTQRPRSYESRVTIQDPRAGGDNSRVISMNHPLAHGGYTFYQSSYFRRGDGFVSVLSVSRDPGRSVVFAGYLVMLLGMVWVLVKRMSESKRGGVGLSPAARSSGSPVREKGLPS